MYYNYQNILNQIYSVLSDILSYLNNMTISTDLTIIVKLLKWFLILYIVNYFSSLCRCR